MPYTPTTYVDGTTPAIDATNLNHAETGIQSATSTAEAAIPKPNAPSANQVLYYNGTAWAAEQIVNALISASAAIDWTKINTTGQITDADIAAGAAITISKLKNYPADATKFLSGAGTWIAASSTTYRTTTAKTWNTSASESTDLLSGGITVDANALSTNKMLRGVLFLDVLGNGGVGNTFTFKLKVGATPTTIFATNGIQIGQSASRQPLLIELSALNLGATNSQAWRMGIRSAGSATGTAWATGEGITMASGGQEIAFGFTTSSIDTTAAMSVQLTVTHSTASASQETKLYGAVFEVI